MLSGLGEVLIRGKLLFSLATSTRSLRAQREALEQLLGKLAAVSFAGASC